MATSLQVFHNLGSLQGTVDRVVHTCAETLHASVRGALDITMLSQQTPAAGRGENGGRVRVWWNSAKEMELQCASIWVIYIFGIQWMSCGMLMQTSMCKTAVSPVLMLWRYCSLALSHWFNLGLYSFYILCMVFDERRWWFCEYSMQTRSRSFMVKFNNNL